MTKLEMIILKKLLDKYERTLRKGVENFNNIADDEEAKKADVVDIFPDKGMAHWIAGTCEDVVHIFGF